MDAEQLPLPKARILIVDDEPTTRGAVSRALQLMGYGTAVAADGSQALSLLEADEFGAMLLDLRMPGIDGVEVMRRVRDRWPNLQMVVLTAHASTDSAIASVRAGAVDYLLKPCSVKEIERALARALQKYQERVRQQRMERVMSQAIELINPPDPSLRGVQPPDSGKVLRRGRVRLDTEKRIVEVSSQDGQTVSSQLTSIESNLLGFLMGNPDHVFSCGELVRVSLGYDVNPIEAEEILRPHVSRLRKKIEVDSTKPCTVCTIRGKGYYFHAA